MLQACRGEEGTHLLYHQEARMHSGDRILCLRCGLPGLVVYRAKKLKLLSRVPEHFLTIVTVDIELALIET